MNVQPLEDAKRGVERDQRGGTFGVTAEPVTAGGDRGPCRNLRDVEGGNQIGQSRRCRRVTLLRLRVSNAGLRIIDKNGIDVVLADLRARGEI